MVGVTLAARTGAPLHPCRSRLVCHGREEQRSYRTQLRVRDCSLCVFRSQGWQAHTTKQGKSSVFCLKCVKLTLAVRPYAVSAHAGLSLSPLCQLQRNLRLRRPSPRNEEALLHLQFAEQDKAVQVQQYYGQQTHDTLMVLQGLRWWNGGKVWYQELTFELHSRYTRFIFPTRTRSQLSSRLFIQPPLREIRSVTNVANKTKQPIESPHQSRACRPPRSE